MNTRRAVLASNTLSNVVNTFTRIFVALFLPPYLIHNLGRDSYGTWALAITFSMGGFLGLLDLGLHQATVKFVAEYLARKEQHKLAQTVSQSLIVYFTMGLIGTGLILGLVALGPTLIFNVPAGLDPTFQRLLAIIAAGLLIEFLSMAFAGILRGYDRLDWLRYAETFCSVGWALSAYLLIRAGTPVTGLAWALVSFNLVRLLSLLALSLRLQPRYQLAIPSDRRLWRGYLAYTFQFTAVKLSSMVWNTVDKAIISIMLVSSLLTDYEIAYKLHQLNIGCTDLVAHSLLPMASAAHARRDDRALRSLLHRGTRYTLAMTMPVVVCSLILVPVFIRHWVGPEYESNAFLARLFLLHFFLYGMLPVASEIVSGMGKVKRIAVATSVGAVTNGLFSLVLTYFFGLPGLAIGSTIAIAVQFTIVVPWALRTLDTSWTTFLKQAVGPVYPSLVVSALALTGCVVLREPQSLLEVAAYGGAAYSLFLICFYLVGATREEREFVRTRLLRRR